MREKEVLALCTYLTQFGSFLEILLNAEQCLGVVFEVGALGPTTATPHFGIHVAGGVSIGGFCHVMVVWNVVKAGEMARVEEVMICIAESLVTEEGRIEDGRRHVDGVSCCI
jgi:hypothetical protein